MLFQISFIRPIQPIKIMNNIHRFQAILAVALAPSLFSPLCGEINSSVSFGSNPDQLGVNRRGLSSAWYHYQDSPVDASDYSVEVKWPIRSGLGFSPGLDSLRRSESLGFRTQMKSVLSGLRIPALTKHDRFHVEAGESFFASGFGAGSNFPIARTFTFTPFGFYEDHGSVSDAGSFNYDMKGNIMIGRHWAGPASVLRHDNSEVIDTAGVKVRTMPSCNLLSRFVTKYQIPIRALMYECAATMPGAGTTSLFPGVDPFLH